MGSFKNLFLQNHWARIGHIYMKAVLYNVDSELFTSWSLGFRRGQSRENHIHWCLYRKKEISRTSKPIFNHTWY
jgi:hypothetical protein